MTHDLSKEKLSLFLGLRGFACLCVIFFHLTDPTTIKNYPYLSLISFLRSPPFIEYGHRWVHMFFVLSGFVLTLGYLSGNPLNYLKNRFLRIFPLHWLIVILYYLHFRIDLNRFGDESLVHQILLTQSWFNKYVHTWNYPAWTLSSEWFLYIVFCFIIFLKKKEFINKNKLLFFLITSITYLSFFPLKNIGIFRAYLIDEDLKAFFIGVSLALLLDYKWFQKIISNKFIFWLSCFLIYFLFKILWFETLTFAFGLLIVAIFGNFEWIQKTIISKMLGGIGLISFSLYMWHIYVLEKLTSFLVGMMPFSKITIYFLVLVMVGYLSYFLFEKIIYQKLKVKFS
jgi:peptidoglycan/LPS O-acetylase OafA/YrhL